MRPIAAVRAESSVGVSTYVDELAHALASAGVTYRPSRTPIPGHTVHFHLANSSRSPLWRAPVLRDAFAVTVHDVLPRTRALLPLYHRALPLLARRASVTIVHSRFAAGLLVGFGVVARRLEVVPHLAPRRASLDRSSARAALGWDDDRPVFVLPGVLKATKLVHEVLEAASPLVRAGRLRLALVGPTRLRALEARAQGAGASLVAAPSTADYREAIIAADAVIVLRADSVGETNGPLLDALAASRPVLATRTGSIPELAGDAARFCEATVHGIRAGLAALCDPGERSARGREAARVARAYRPETVARAHAELLTEVLDG